MEPTAHELQVFQSLAQSSEGEAISKYIDRVRDHLRDTVIDDPNATLADLAGARETRKALKVLQDRFVARARMGTVPDQFS